MKHFARKLIDHWKSITNDEQKPLRSPAKLSKNCAKKNSTKHVMDGRIGKRTLSWITREKVKLMEMFTFSLKLYEANTPNDYKMDMGKLKSVYWHSSTYGKLPILFSPFRSANNIETVFCPRSHSYLYGKSIFFRYIFFLPEQFAILPSRYTQLETWIK